MSIVSVAFRCGLTADSRLLIARVCGRESFVALRGLTQIKLYDPHTSVDRTRHWPRVWVQHCGAGHPRSSPPATAVIDSSAAAAWTGRMLRGQSRDQTMHVLVCWKAWQHPVEDWPHIPAFQMTGPEHETCVRARYHLISGGVVSQGQRIRGQYLDIT